MAASRTPIALLQFFQLVGGGGLILIEQAERKEIFRFLLFIYKSCRECIGYWYAGIDIIDLAICSIYGIVIAALL